MPQDQTPFPALQSNFDRDFEQARARHNLLSAVTAALDPTNVAPTAVYDSGYCAEASVYFDFSAEGLPSLLKSYPPEPVVLVQDGSLTQKPESHLRDAERRGVVLPLAPLLLKAGKSSEAPVLHWWSKLSSGHLVQVHLRQATMAAFQSQVGAPRYELDSQSYSTGCTNFGRRALASPPTGPSALERWLDSWDQFATQEGYRGAQLSFLKAIKSFVMMEPSPHDWVAEGLPEPNLLKGGTAVAIPEGVDMLEHLEALRRHAAERKEHWMDRVGDFWSYYDREAAQRFWSFCVQKNETWLEAKAADNAQAQQVQAALEELCQNGRPNEDYVLWKYLNHAVQARTGLKPNLRVATRHADGRLEVDCRLSSSRVREVAYHRLMVQTNPERTLRPQDVPVTYVE